MRIQKHFKNQYKYYKAQTKQLVSQTLESDDVAEFIIFDVFNFQYMGGRIDECVFGAAIGSGIGAIVASLHYGVYTYNNGNKNTYKYYSDIWTGIFVLICLYLWGKIGKYMKFYGDYNMEIYAIWLNGFICFFGGYRLWYFILSWMIWKYSLLMIVILFISWINFLRVL